MRFRSIIVCTLALATLAGAVLSGISFATFSANGAPAAAWLFNITACVLVFMLGFSIKGGTHSLSILLGLLAVCLPAIGPAIAALVALSIHFMRPVREDDELFEVGNPVSLRSNTGQPGSVLRLPMVESVRKLSHINLFRLLTGIGSLPPRDARPVLARLRDCEDAQLQLFAQGGLNDALDASERHLKVLKRRAASHRDEAATHCSIAEIHLYLLENHLVEEDDRPTTWDAASHAISDALKADPQDALSLKICAQLNLIGGDPEKAKLAAGALAEIPGHEENAQLLQAEAAFENGEFDSAKEKLESIRPGASKHNDILDFWRKPRPVSYV